MSPMKLSIWHVDDSFQDFDLTPAEFSKLRSLQSSGLKGKELVDAWGFGFEGSGAPPLKLEVKGLTPDGESVSERIVYE
jgi:hypothetical protein